MTSSAVPPHGSPLESHAYQVGGSLPVGAPTYVIRKADQDLYKGLKDGQLCYVFNARQMGKSSLRVQAMQRLKQEGFACALVDMTELGTSGVTPEQWYAGIIDRLLDSFHLYESFDLEKWWNQHSLLSPVQHFGLFLGEVLLKSVSQTIVIFWEEIDSVFGLGFETDDFFAILRNCYDKRSSNPEYSRLIFALIGVATPSDLIRDRRQSPFNLGQGIELEGLQLEKSLHLLAGMTGKTRNTEAVLKAIFDWTGGQPFLTQKLCKLAIAHATPIPEGKESDWVNDWVFSKIINNWETQDDPPHFKPIGDRLLWNERRVGRLLGLYQRILQAYLNEDEQSCEKVAADDSLEQIELRLSGLVVKREGQLQIYNRLYALIFNHEWINSKLSELRPYSEFYSAWVESNYQDESRLLRGRALQEALAWAASKSLSDRDYQYLTASQELDKREAERALETERRARALERLEAEINLEAEKTALEAQKQANQVLGAAALQARRRIRLGSIILAISLVGAAIATLFTYYAEQSRKVAQAATQLEQAGLSAWQRFEGGDQLQALLTALENGQRLDTLMGGDRPSLEQYPALSPIFALQTILNQIREQNILQHPAPVQQVVVSSDGYLATAGDDTIARLWKLPGQSPGQALGQAPIELKGHQNPIYGIAFNPDGQLIATVSQDQTVRLWNLSGEEITHFQVSQGATFSVVFSSDGQQIITTGEDGIVRAWSLTGQKLNEFTAHSQPIYGMSISPDGQQLATASKDGTARLWNLTGEELAQLTGHTGFVRSVHFSPDGQQLITTGEDRTARLWDLSGNQKRVFQGHFDWVMSATFSPDGQHIVTTSGDSTTKIWNLSGQQLDELRGHVGWIGSVVFSPDGNYLVTAGEDGTARVWNFSQHTAAEFLAHPQSIARVSYGSTGQHIATASSDGTGALWDLSGRKIAEFKGHEADFTGGEARVWSVSISPDEQQIATAGSDGTVRLWNLSGQQIALIQDNRGDWFGQVTFSPDGEQIATTGENGAIQLWSLSGELLTEIQVSDRGYLWDLSFSPDGEAIAITGENGVAQLWSLSGEQIADFKGHQGTVNNIRFSSDGERIVTAAADGTVRLWNRAGQQLLEIKSHTGRVRGVSLSPNGQLIATGGDDGKARLWSFTGQQIAEFDDFQGAVRGVVFSPDSKHLVTVGDDGIVKVWRVEAGLDELIKRGCDWIEDYLATHSHVKTVCSE